MTDNADNSDAGNFQKRLIPLTKWNDYHPWPPIGGLRHLIFNSRTNDFEKVYLKVGGRILIIESEFFVWAWTKNEEAKVN